MKTYLWIVVVFVTATVGLFWSFGAGFRTLFEIALVVLGLVPAVVKATPRLYISWTKARFWIGNVSATWDLSIRFQKFAGDATLNELVGHIQRRMIGTTILVQSDVRAVLRTRRFVIEVSAQAAQMHMGLQDPELALSIAPVTVGYRDSTRFLEQQLLPLIESCRDALGARWASYSLRVDLPEHNPYVGVYLQNIPLTPMQEFRIQFALPDATETKIVVGKERLTVISDTLEQFRRAVGAALAFRVPVR